jgi:hypothetical protein
MMGREYYFGNKTRKLGSICGYEVMMMFPE